MELETTCNEAQVKTPPPGRPLLLPQCFLGYQHQTGSFSRQSAGSGKMALLHSSQPTHTSADSSVVLLLVPVREFPPHVCDEQDPRPLREEISPPPKFQRM